MISLFQAGNWSRATEGNHLKTQAFSFLKGHRVNTAGESLTLLPQSGPRWGLAVSFPLTFTVMFIRSTTWDKNTFALPDKKRQWADTLCKPSAVGAWFTMWVFFVLNWQKEHVTTVGSFVEFIHFTNTDFFFSKQEIRHVKMWEKCSLHRCYKIQNDKTKQLHKTLCDARDNKKEIMLLNLKKEGIKKTSLKENNYICKSST